MIKNQQNKKVKAIYNKIINYKKVTIFCHQNPDNDAYNSSLAMCLFLRSLKIDARIEGVDLITNVDVLKQVNKKIPKPTKNFYKNSLAIVLDLGTEKNLITNNFSLCKESVRIDHHPKTENFCNLEWVDIEYSSTCEMVGWFILKNNPSKMSKEIANSLYVGILTDSGNLQFNCAKASTYLLVSKFFEYNFDKQKKQEELYLRKIDEVKVNNKIFKKIKFIDDEIAYLVITPRMQKKYNLSKNDSKIFLMSNIKEIKVWFSMYYLEENGPLKVSIRSRSYPVRQIAQKFGGGGHELASGFTIPSISYIRDIINEVKKIINKK